MPVSSTSPGGQEALPVLLGDMADACRSPRGRATTRREGFCTPTKTVDERCVAILFLAHDGVANPEIWERWRDSQPEYASRIIFCVFRNRTLKYESAFADQYDSRIRRSTTWCSSSIVRATLDGLQYIALNHPQAAITYVVSGLDVPLQPPEAMFATREVVTEGVGRVIEPFRTVMAYLPENHKDVTEWSGWSGDEEVRDHLTCHVQWCALSKAHVQRLVDYPHTDRLLKIGNRLSCVWCPDEWVIGTILSLQGVDLKRETIDWTVTDHYRQNRKAPSPVTWTNLCTSKQRVFWAPPAFFRTFTLQAIINNVSRREGNLFFRKVGRLSPEEVDEFMLPPPPYTPTKARSTLIVRSIRTRASAAADRSEGTEKQEAEEEQEVREEVEENVATPPRRRVNVRGRGRCCDKCAEGEEEGENRDPNPQANGAMPCQGGKEVEGGEGLVPEKGMGQGAVNVAKRPPGRPRKSVSVDMTPQQTPLSTAEVQRAKSEPDVSSVLETPVRALRSGRSFGFGW